MADQAADALQDLEDRSEQMAEVDPAQAQAMAQAAQLGQRSRVEETLDQAAQNIAQNRTQQAQQQQQAAAQALQEMLEELDNAGRNRDQALRRVLASAIESIQSLIKQQEGELALLAKAMQTDEFDLLDTGMIRLHQNTLGVAGELATSFQELAQVADIIREAADEQSTAIVELRDANTQGAEESELESLDALNRALAEAERLDEEAAQRDQDRKLQELRKAYRDMLEQQVAIRAETKPFVGIDLARRQRAQVRGLGGRQEALRELIAQLPEQYEELSQAPVFEFAHERIDEALATASETLSGAVVNAAVIRRQDSAVRLLRSLVRALEDLEQDEEAFREGEQEGGEGGGSGQQGEQPMIPPIKELLLLRALQQEAADLTKAVNDDASAEQEEITDVAAMQRGLAEQAKSLIDRLQQQQPAGPDGEQGERPGGDPR